MGDTFVKQLLSTLSTWSAIIGCAEGCGASLLKWLPIIVIEEHLKQNELVPHTSYNGNAEIIRN